MRILATAAIGLLLWAGSWAFAVAATDGPQEEARHRLVVLTDIEADPDDTQSLIRLLLYANEIDIEGLVATTSTHRRTSPASDSIREVVAVYEAVRPNLLLHEEGYPAAAALERVIVDGVPAYGIAAVGTGRDTEGSNLIIRALEADDPRPVWVSVWGGANTLAQALHTLRETRSETELRRLTAKLRVYTISDQDDAGPWIRREFPGVFYIVTPGDNYGAATWNAINRFVDGIDNGAISNGWLSDNIQQGHGPLGALYPDVVWGVEGDTPAFLSLIPNGLNAPERPDWGGWGGRYELYTPEGDTTLNNENLGPETRPIWTNAVDAFGPLDRPEYGRASRDGAPRYEDALVSLWRWRDDFQNDFAARMDWTVQTYAEANHPPEVVLGQPRHITVRSGQGFGLTARDSRDPDGDSLSFHWFHYPEAGTYEGEPLTLINGANLWTTAPTVTEPVTLHILVRVTDKGSPPLTRYGRTIVTVQP